MTSFALSLGCALLAFSPTLSLLLLFAYSKAQLVIIVTTASFAQLLACLLGALLHLPFKGLSLGAQSVFIVIPTSILSQAFCRCGFVFLYHKVESVIESSISHHEQRERRQNQRQSSLSENDNASGEQDQLSETAQLRLELNDASAGLAAGVGFGFFHTVMLYGTLLASENSRLGTLYQESCTFMPSVFNSAIMAFFFGILDLVWMLMTFYGMRRFPLFSFGRNSANASASATSHTIHSSAGGMDGKWALLLVVLTHSAASFATVPNQLMAVNGCVVALPLLAFVAIGTVVMFWILFKSRFLPENQQLRIRHANRLHMD